ncbi:Fatty acid desaturase [Ectocarpus siliculosus]|uniref:Fatty acid desaturase n=1 Tax=Ectocarpus siliculosus TaxID=2880 RepID=D7FSV5_ECTSI|nr:Fatty acid desaturase [Ectocarpus siliculosus]|eukprot:CBJ31246.1 Fatty acid desaturase [Ectocarpus siliculosus]
MTRLSVSAAVGAALVATSSAFTLNAVPSSSAAMSTSSGRGHRRSRACSASRQQPSMVTSVPRTVPETGTKAGAASKQRLHVQLGDAFYDLTGWRKLHPAGNHWIDRYAERDATDVMAAFHSDDAFDRLKTLPKVKGKEIVEPNSVTKNFRAFRKELVEAGWFKRIWYKDASIVALQVGTFAAGIVLSRTNPWLGVVVMGLAHTTGGWLAHDMVHGRGKFCSAMRHYGAVTCGLSSKWWSEKHNLHHAFTNVVGVDEDIMPPFWLWAPKHRRDRPWRKFQHLYWPLPFSLTFLLWRIDSVRTAIAKKLKLEGGLLALHYCLLAALVPLPVAIGHIFLGGWLTATLVTVTHTAEEYAAEDDSSYVETQFRTTRDAITDGPVAEYVWGGMQYQLEHHLFPTIPRYKYRQLVPLVRKFAEENGIEYRATPQWEIIKDNLALLKRVGSSPVMPGSPAPGAADIDKK